MQKWVMRKGDVKPATLEAIESNDCMDPSKPDSSAVASTAAAKIERFGAPRNGFIENDMISSVS